MFLCAGFAFHLATGRKKNRSFIYSLRLSPSAYPHARFMVLLFISTLLGWILARFIMQGTFDWLLYDWELGDTFDSDDHVLEWDVTSVKGAKWKFPRSNFHTPGTPSAENKAILGPILIAPASAIYTFGAFILGGPFGCVIALPSMWISLFISIQSNADGLARRVPVRLEDVRITLVEGDITSKVIVSSSKRSGGISQEVEVNREHLGVELKTHLNVARGHEAVARFTTKSEPARCYANVTDGMIDRKLSTSRWLPVESQFFPVSLASTLLCSASPGDAARPLFTLVPYSATGVRSIMEGTDVGFFSSTTGIEAMLHRSLSVDDEKGLREPLVDTSRANLHHLLVFHDNGMSTSVSRTKTALAYQNPPVAFDFDNRRENLSTTYPTTTLSSRSKMPHHVHISSIQWWPTASSKSTLDDFSNSLRGLVHEVVPFPEISGVLASVRHPRSSRAVFLRLHNLDTGPEATFVQVESMLNAPRGHVICGAQRTSLDFLPLSARLRAGENGPLKKDEANFAIGPGEMAAVVLSFCQG